MVTEIAPGSNVNTNAAIAGEQMPQARTQAPQAPEILIEPDSSYVNLEPGDLATFLLANSIF